MKYVERKWATILRKVSENTFEVLQFEIVKKKIITRLFKKNFQGLYNFSAT